MERDVNKMMLIEVSESDIEKLKIPFVIYAAVGKNIQADLKALYAELDRNRQAIDEARQNMADTYRKINEHYKTQYDDS